jgi:hypothetical protein
LIVRVARVRQFIDRRNAIRLILANSILRNMFDTKFISPSKRPLDFRRLKKIEEFLSSIDLQERATTIKLPAHLCGLAKSNVLLKKYCSFARLFSSDVVVLRCCVLYRVIQTVSSVSQIGEIGRIRRDRRATGAL